MRSAIKYIIDKYGSHNAFYRRPVNNKHLPLFYVYDSYQVKAKEWSKLFGRLTELSVRDTEYDGIFIGSSTRFSSSRSTSIESDNLIYIISLIP